jgi:hypothetical protein
MSSSRVYSVPRLPVLRTDAYWPKVLNAPYRLFDASFSAGALRTQKWKCGQAAHLAHSSRVRLLLGQDQVDTGMCNLGLAYVVNTQQQKSA